MKQRPTGHKLPAYPYGAQPVALPRKDKPIQRPQDQPGKVEPFYKSDAFLWHLATYESETLSTAPDGVQLVTHLYIPAGKTGFLKQIRIAPYIPTSWTAFYAGLWMAYFGTPGDRPNWLRGVWETPAGWEAFCNTTDKIPYWRWHLRFLDGNIDDIKRTQNIPAFDINVPQSWYLVSPQPVPRKAYGSSLPGSAPGNWPPQKLQRIGNQEDSDVHVVVPENTTILLFCEWKQEFFTIGKLAQVGIPSPAWDDFPDTYPLLPSFGALIGYTQANSQQTTLKTAVEGWQG